MKKIHYGKEIRRTVPSRLLSMIGYVIPDPLFYTGDKPPIDTYAIYWPDENQWYYLNKHYFEFTGKKLNTRMLELVYEV